MGIEARTLPRPGYPRWREDSLTTIVGMLEDLGYGDKFPVIALAKKEETVYTTDGRELLMDRRGRMIIHAPR